MNLEEEIIKLRSDDIVQQVASLTTARASLGQFIEQAVFQLRISQSPILLAEKIFEFGTIVIPALEEVVVSESSQNIREIAAAVLVQLGSRNGIDLLLDAVRKPGSNHLLAVTSLAKANIVEASDPILEALRSCKPDFYMRRENAPYLETHLAALRRLGRDLPDDLKSRFTGMDVPAEIRRFLDNGASNRPN